jgi:glycosyltransferase involved in cell wall biosynthesis
MFDASLRADRNAGQGIIDASRPPSGDSVPAPFVLLSTYPPRRCGIAAFSRDLRSAIGGGHVAAVRRPGDEDAYPPEVAWQIDHDAAGDYLSVARSLGWGGVDVASIQHEYGIFGGPDGSHVLGFAEALEVPAVSTLHTVLAEPTPGQRAVLGRLVQRSAATIVMSLAAARLVRREYGGEDARIEVIHHGVPDVPLVDADAGKPELGLAGRTVILSFGLLGPGKGYEHMIEAMDHLRRRHPEALFVILGATHPDLLRSEGERYREGLQAGVDALGLADHVWFLDRYAGPEEVVRYLQATDVYVTPYPNLAQIVSGTLSWAVGAGKAIVSTPFTYAREMLAEGRGVIVEPGSGAALADGIGPLLDDPSRRLELGRRAWAFGRRMIWSEVGAAYRRVFAEVGATGRRTSRTLVPTPRSWPLPVHG